MIEWIQNPRNQNFFLFGSIQLSHQQYWIAFSDLMKQWFLLSHSCPFSISIASETGEPN